MPPAGLLAGTATSRDRAAVSAAVALVGVAGLLTVNPNTTHVPLCPLHALTGLSCPLCGITRACWELLHGSLGAALHDNAMFVLSLPLLALLWWRWLWGGPGRRPLPATALRALAVLAILFGVLRNLPAGSWLAPVG